MKLDNNLLINVIIACIPAGIIGFLFKDYIENIFFSITNQSGIPSYLIINYLLFGIIIYLSKYFYDNKNNTISTLHALIIGIVQVIAFMPGISRSGITIVIALFLGYNFKEATKFSFYLAIPIIFFACLESIYSNYVYINDKLMISLIMGFISSVFFGYVILSFLNIIIQKNKYWCFSFYCFLMSIFLMVYNYGY